MPSSATTRLLRVLDLEEKQGWRNRAVIGGLQAMVMQLKRAAQARRDEQRQALYFGLHKNDRILQSRPPNPWARQRKSDTPQGSAEEDRLAT